MKCRILHESSARMRVHICKYSMTMDQADLLEAYLKDLSFVVRARVDERTMNAVICYESGHRDEVISALSSFDYETTQIAVPEHTTRALSRAYEDKMVFHIARRLVSRFVLPISIRPVWTALKSIPYLIRGAKSLTKGKLEVTVLDAASITVSMLRGEFDTAGSVMFLLGIGDIMEEWTHRKSVADLAGAMALNVDKVWVKTPDGQEVLTELTHVQAGETIVVRRGTMIPLDGVVKAGDGCVNQASMTGESLPVHKMPGAFVYAGTAVEEGELEITVSQGAGSGRYDRVVRMIEESEKLKSSTEDKASHLADRLVPWTLGGSLLTYLLTGNAARAASILMVDFCCALKLSMPIAVLSALREAGAHQISVKGGKFMEAYAEATTMVFDKTGTLTNASPSVRDVVAFGGRDATEMLRLSACLEEHYPHSMANAVVAAANEKGLEHQEEHSRVEYVVAHGIASSVGDQKVRIGSYHFIFEDEGCVLPEGEQEKFDALPDDYSHLYLAIDGVLAAVILIEDPLKEEAASTIAALHQMGFERIVMMTGDSERTARAVAARVGVDDYRSEVLPEDKAAFIREEHLAGRKVIMIGDGINDTPALSESDCGVAINSGAAIAREIADVTISQDDLRALVTMRRLSDGLMERIHANYRTIISFNTFLIVMGAVGIFPSATTALLHNASTIAISLRSMTNLLEEG